MIFHRLRRHWARIAITLIPVVLALLQAAGLWRLPFIDRLDHFIEDVRLRATMPRTFDPRIVIVDIDDPSLQQLGQWPWGRDQLAQLSTELLVRQQAAVLAFDVLIAEPDRSSALDSLRALADGPLRNQPEFVAHVERLAPSLDHDAIFARAIAGRPVALGYYLTRTPEPRATGHLPAPVLPMQIFPAGQVYGTGWNGFGASIDVLARAAPTAGFFNVLARDSDDGIVRSVPLIARYDGPAAPAGYYESLALATYRLARGMPEVVPEMAAGSPPGGRPIFEALRLGGGDSVRRVPVDQTASVRVPFRGPGGAQGGSFRYVAAADVLRGRLAPGELRGKIVMVGATAPGLQDVRATPVGGTYPGVEVHANIVSGMLDGRLTVVPDYAPGYGVVTVFLAGLLLAVGMSVLPAFRAMLLGAGVVAALVALNTALYLQAGLVLPLAAALVMTAAAFVINMSWSYFVESRARRNLARLFGTYVPPQLVDEMVVRPERYSMRAESKELTVMFCDMRGFTELSESMTPTELQALLNTVFSRLTDIISRHRGTVDKYMGDCVMAFWGAPVDMPDHAALAVQAAFEMAAAVRQIDEEHRATGRPRIAAGIGLNTGVMSVGDMGSAVRRSYTVVGDAVNLAARLEGLGLHYGVQIVASEATRRAAPAFEWEELDAVRVRGSARAVAIFTPLARAGALDPTQSALLERWNEALAAYRSQRFATAVALLASLRARDAKKVLYGLYAQRLASMAAQPKNPNWDGATRFENK